MNTRSKNLTEIFTTEGIERLENRLKKDKHVILTFRQKGKDHHYKIKVKDNKVYGKELNMYDPEMLRVVDVKEET